MKKATFINQNITPPKPVIRKQYEVQNPKATIEYKKQYKTSKFEFAGIKFY